MTGKKSRTVGSTHINRKLIWIVPIALLILNSCNNGLKPVATKRFEPKALQLNADTYKSL